VTELSIEVRVAAGAKWLDCQDPWWIERVDVGLLDLADCKRCVLGQMFGIFHDAPLLADVDWTSDAGVAQADALTVPRGFDLPDDEEDSFPALTAEWRRLIESRREAS
jgi:hypothetical protein